MVKTIKTKAKQVFIKTKIPGADYVMNQYVGCEHACTYCYAKFMCKWKKHGKWGTWIEAKMNAPDLAKNKLVKGQVIMSSISDPYQPVEKNLKLTRKLLKTLDKNTDLEILTKSDLIIRDIDLFKKFKKIKVGLTINTFDNKAKKIFEPIAPSYEKRINTLKILKNNGIKTYGFISPVIPELTDLELIISKSQKFVYDYIIEIINLRAAGWEFKKILKEKYPKIYEVLTNKETFEKFIETTKIILKKSQPNNKTIKLVIHYPKLNTINL